jgi:hypothetical protein
VLLAKVYNFPISIVTVVPGIDFWGRVLAPDADPSAPLADQLIQTKQRCGEAAALRPGAGEDQDCYAPWASEAHMRIVELVAGSEGERLATGKANLPANTDLALAILYAETISSPAAIDQLLAWARAEARGILKAHWTCVLAIAQALDDRGTLDGPEIDTIIADAVAQATQEAERIRRRNMARMVESAARFRAMTIEERGKRWRMRRVPAARHSNAETRPARVFPWFTSPAETTPAGVFRRLPGRQRRRPKSSSSLGLATMRQPGRGSYSLAGQAAK